MQQLSLRLSQVSEKELLRRGDKYEDLCYYWEMVCAYHSRHPEAVYPRLCLRR